MRALGNMLDDFEIMSGWEMVCREERFEWWRGGWDLVKRVREYDLLLYVRVKRCVTCGSQMATRKGLKRNKSAS